MGDVRHQRFNGRNTILQSRGHTIVSIPGAKYFPRDSDSDTLSSYNTGLRTLIIMVAVGIVFAALQIVIYVVHNKMVAEGKHKTKDGKEPMIYVP